MIRSERYYPIAMILENEPVLVVGGGRVAERKILSLLDAGARVAVITHEAGETVRTLAEEGRIGLRLGDVCEADLEEPVLVIGATDDADLHTWLSAECRARRVPVNIVDVVPLCSFFVPASFRRGPLTIALMSGGEAPALAKKLRRTLEGVVGAEYGLLAELMGELRPEILARIARIEDRSRGWERLVESEELLGLLRAGERSEARTLAREILGL